MAWGAIGRDERQIPKANGRRGLKARGAGAIRRMKLWRSDPRLAGRRVMHILEGLFNVETRDATASAMPRLARDFLAASLGGTNSAPLGRAPRSLLGGLSKGVRRIRQGFRACVRERLSRQRRASLRRALAQARERGALGGAPRSVGRGFYKGDRGSREGWLEPCLRRRLRSRRDAAFRGNMAQERGGRFRS